MPRVDASRQGPSGSGNTEGVVDGAPNYKTNRPLVRAITPKSLARAAGVYGRPGVGRTARERNIFSRSCFHHSEG